MKSRKPTSCRVENEVHFLVKNRAKIRVRKGYFLYVGCTIQNEEVEEKTSDVPDSYAYQDQFSATT